MAAAFATFPALRLPRPALELLGRLGPSFQELSLGGATDIARKPRSTVARWLSGLVDERIVLRIRRDEYAVPSRPTLTLLLNETSAYARSLLLHHEVLSHYGLPHAFACVPIRRVLPFRLEDAAPVLNLHDKRVRNLDAADYPNAFRTQYAASERRMEELRFPTAAANEPDAIPRRFPVLSAETSLALFAASADARIVNAAFAAANKLGIHPEVVKERAASYVVETPPLKVAYPNTLVLPQWLSRFHHAAAASLAQRYLAEEAQPPSTPAGEEE